MHIHETAADAANAPGLAARSPVIESGQFRRPCIKRHNPKTVRKNTGASYHGCLVIYVRSSADLYRRIEGWAVRSHCRCDLRTDRLDPITPDMLPREDLNLNCRDQNPKSCRLDDAGRPEAGQNTPSCRLERPDIGRTTAYRAAELWVGKIGARCMRPALDDHRLEGG